MGWRSATKKQILNQIFVREGGVLVTKKSRSVDHVGWGGEGRAGVVEGVSFYNVVCEFTLLGKEQNTPF